MRLSTRLSPHQLVTLWGELIEAYYGVNGFGGATAEIYAYTLIDHSALLDAQFADSDTGRSARLESAKEAGLALHEVLTHFCRERECSAEIDGVPFGGAVWPFDHRVHVRIIREKGPTP